MDEFLKVINGIDWDQLHRQKYEVLEIISLEDNLLKKKGELQGLVNLIDDLQDVAAKLRIWTFPSERFDGVCPECNGRNYEFLEEDDDVLTYECYDCGNTFDIDPSEDHSDHVCTCGDPDCNRIVGHND